MLSLGVSLCYVFSVGYSGFGFCGWLFLGLLPLVWCFKFLGGFVVCDFVVELWVCVWCWCFWIELLLLLLGCAVWWIWLVDDVFVWFGDLVFIGLVYCCCLLDAVSFGAVGVLTFVFGC